MKLFTGILLALLFVGCQSNDQSVVESPSDPLINAQNDSSEVEKTVEEVEQNDLKENGLPIAKKYATIVHNTLEESGWSVDTDSFYLLATQKAIAKDLKNR